MISKIYLVLLAISVAAMSFFIYYACSWLQSIGAPSAAVAGFEYHFGTANTFLWISSFVLLIVANATLWTKDKAWPIWGTFLYFLLSMLGLVWLLIAANGFLKENSLPLADPHGVITFAFIIICIFAGLFAFCNQFAVVRLKKKMYASAEKGKHDDISPDTADETESAN